MKKKILLLDESGIFIRHCLGGKKFLSTSEGYVTGGVYGYIESVLDTAFRIKPDHIVCCADSSRRTLERKEIYPLYKENREKKAFEIPNYQWQKKAIQTFGELFKIERLLVPGQEADDVIASIAHQLGGKYEIYILSGDKDMVQLITDDVKVILSNKRDENGDNPLIENLEGAANVLGVHPSVAVLDQALQGDAADNYSGGCNIGAKSASLLATKFKSIENIYKNLDDPMFLNKDGSKKALHRHLLRELTPKEIEKWGYEPMGIKTNRQAIELSYKLAQLKLDIELDLKLYNYAEMIDVEKLKEFFDEMEFESFLRMFE